MRTCLELKVIILVILIYGILALLSYIKCIFIHNNIVFSTSDIKYVCYLPSYVCISIILAIVSDSLILMTS